MDTKNENTTPNPSTAVEEHDVTKMNATQLRLKVVDLEEKLTAAKTNLGALMAEVEVLGQQVRSGLTDEELAKKGFFHRGSMLTMGLGQDVTNLINDPTIGGKVFHTATAAVKVVGIGTSVGLVYGTIKNYLGKRSAAKAAEALAPALGERVGEVAVAGAPLMVMVSASFLAASSLGGAICSS
jgi:hypothetical protein